jgi:predicted outer membrane protein
LGNLAKKKSNNESVKGFGSMMVKNHTEAHHKRKDLGKPLHSPVCEQNMKRMK